MGTVFSLSMRVSHQRPEARAEALPTGFVRVERGAQRAVLLVPELIDPARLYPLVTVLHGAGRQDEILAKLFRDEPDARSALFLIPRSLHPTWDLIAGANRSDLEASAFAYGVQLLPILA